MKLSHTEVRKGTIISLNGEPYEVMQHAHSFKGRGGSVMQTRLRNLKNGTLLQKTFHAKDEVEEASIEKEDAFFVYANRGKCIFAKENKERLQIDEKSISEKIPYLKENTPVTILFFNEDPISVSIPIKVNLKVKESPPGIRGDRSQGGTKTVTVETGALIEVPLFVKEGDVIEINTETGEYVRRVQD